MVEISNADIERILTCLDIAIEQLKEKINRKLKKQQSEK